MAKSKSAFYVQVTHGTADAEDTTALAAVPFGVAVGIVESALAASGEGPYVFRVPEEHVEVSEGSSDVVLVALPREQFRRVTVLPREGA